MHELEPGILVFDRAECGIQAESPASYCDPYRLFEFLVHHTTGSNLGALNPFDWWRNIDRYHRDVLGYDDIAYCWGVARGDSDDTALVLTGRGWDRFGAHTLGHNGSGVGVVLLGDGADPANITPGIERAFAALQRVHASIVDADRQVLLTHRDVNPTACPGDALYERAHAGWPGAGGSPLPAPPAPEPPIAPPWPGRLFTFPPYTIGEDVRTWQARMAERGWTIDVDGWYGPQSQGVALAFQAEKGLEVDGIVGPITWDAAWTAPIT